MPDRRRDAYSLRSHGALPHGGAESPNTRLALTAAAQLLGGTEPPRPYQYSQWQDEAWEFYENLGEFNYGVEWFGEALSRVRLLAAKVTPGGDEPEVLDAGPAVDLVSSLVGGTDGQAQLLRSLGIQLSVPGEAYVVGREVTDDDVRAGLVMDAEPDEHGRVWTVQPTSTLRRTTRTIRSLLGRRPRGWEIQVDDAAWAPLPVESLVARVWDRHERTPWRAMSPARAALPIMREIDMYNRQIIATLVSRVALNGMLLIPDEITLPSNPTYEDAVDPFIAELIDIMHQAIKNPGSPASAMPMPLRVPAEYVERFKHLTFSTPLDKQVFENRSQAIHRLAATLNLPAEIVTGMGSVNHWGQWQLTEDAIKIHVSPKVEIITRCLTTGYLHPMLTALGEDTRTPEGDRIIIWYDTSELTQRPDRSASAIQLRQMLVITDEATRRETGFDEADAPTDDELERMVLMQLAVNPQTAVPALKELTGLELEMPQPAPVADAAQDQDAGGPVGAPGPGQRSATGVPPATRDEPPPEPDASAVTAGANGNGRHAASSPPVRIPTGRRG